LKDDLIIAYKCIHTKRRLAV